MNITTNSGSTWRLTLAAARASTVGSGGLWRVFKGRLPFIVFLGTGRSWTRTLIPSNLTWHSIDTWIRSMLELTQLRCFTTVATELNFRRAAERLNMTQPPLSRQIQLLEHHLGVALFTRSTRSVALTAAGRAFFIEAQNLLERAQQAAAAAKRFAEGDIGSVTISFVGSAVYEFLPKVIAEARLRQPHVKICLEEMNTYQQHEAMRARRIDLGIVRSP